MPIYQPYTYLIGWSNQDRWYYGVRFAKNCHPNDLFNPYQTSSDVVKAFIKENGLPDVIAVRRVFVTAEAACYWEQKVLRRLKVNIDERWLNKTYNGCFIFRQTFSKDRKHRISEYQKLRWSSMDFNERNTYVKNRKRPKRIYLIGSLNGMFNKKRTKNEKLAISIGTKSAMNNENLTEHLSIKAKARCTLKWRQRVSKNNKRRICCINCHTEMGISSLGRHQHGQRCITNTRFPKTD